MFLLPREITMDSTKVCLQNVLVQGVSVTCLGLATEYLTKNVAHNLVNAGFFFLSYSNLLGSVYFKQMKIKHADFSIHWHSFLVLFYVFCFIIFIHIFVLITYFLILMPGK